MRILPTIEDIFDLPSTTNGSEAVCVTTNGMIKKNGHAVMGKGVALDANNRFHISLELADKLRKYGNHVFDLGIKTTMNNITEENVAYHIITFPTKHNWRDNSDLNLIKQSAEELVKIVNEKDIERVFLTPPGCGCGNLNWDKDVNPILKNIFTDNRFIIVMRH